jgi:Lon protease-like protein
MINRLFVRPRTFVNRLVEFDTVRVVAFVGTAESHLAVSGADRPPRVSDLGTVVHLVSTTDPDDPGTRYIVECGDGQRCRLIGHDVRRTLRAWS